jgi:zinc transport system ATP-binding protein
MAKILSVQNLSVVFDNQTVINNISFELEEGETLAIIGPNGSGKTVLLKALLGIIPFQGKVEWAKNVNLGYVPQKVDADRHLPLSTENLLAAKAKILGLSKQEIVEVIRKVNLGENYLGAPVGHLSGGQFQKALIAFALLGNPRVILFDEPTASLDQLSEEHIYELIHELQEKHGITVILVSHELSIVYHYATQVLCLNKEKLCFGHPEEALTTEILKKLYGAPHKFHPRHAEEPHHGH